ncbi:Shikimate dehydrogenase (NADP(+)) [Thalictrum thalictroides]|uniref:Shikimate dehydrogenase (NADP(+)) n=1 Tax=Thalictrum thalictroides TaxID=46969 RepID=A0A7J6XCY8_THATH|nr:Shikimate dehydrogenase (NADP(+)) [Thalictrum thalictroides]
MALKMKDVLICTTLQCNTVEQMFSSMDIAKTEGADLVELRIDSLSFSHISDVEKLIKQKTLPAIVSFRLDQSGGSHIQGKKSTCFQVLKRALQLNADFIEVEFEVASDFLASVNIDSYPNSKLIVSCHVDVTPSKDDLSFIVARLQSTGADIIKLSFDTVYITDVVPLFHVLSHCQVPLIACAMGDKGLISQLLCPKFGGFFVYGTIGSNPIPGLPTLGTLRHVYKIKKLNVDTKVFGLIANPVGHSKGPLLHNPAFSHAGYNGIYVPLLVDNIEEFFRVYSSPDFAGFSVGIPHKEGAVRCCDEVHPLAKSIGAVNTIVRRSADGKLVGYNTDCEASITAIEDALRARRSANGDPSHSHTSPLSGKVFVLVGAGGAGRALAFGAKSRGARVFIFNRTYGRAKALALAVSGEALPYEDLNNFCPGGGMILVNATSVGMQPHSDQTPVAKEALGAYELVFDAVYTPRNTRLLREAEEVGAIVVSGVEMFIRQAIGQFNLFTNGEARRSANGDPSHSHTSPLSGKVFVLVGAGGAGRALAFGAKSRGARVFIFNRTYGRAKALALAVSGEALPYEDLNNFCPGGGMILVNATSVGMQPHSDQTPVAKEALGAYELVFDAVYTPRNTRLLREAEEVGAIVVSGVEMFIRQAIGQFNLFTNGEEPGIDDEEKKGFFDQVTRLNMSYPGGLMYVHNARKLLLDSKAGKNPFDGFTPSVPLGEVDSIGERLGYNGIKLALPLESTTGTCFLQHYIESILALQKASCRVTQGQCKSQMIPLVIMTSDDTHECTLKLLQLNAYFFGMMPSQVKLLKQEKVACLENNDARLAVDPHNKYRIQTKPHGHGDVHSLLYSSGLLSVWHDAGLKWVLFSQDTNGLLFKAIPASLGVSSTKQYHVNSLAVPRKAKEAIGGIAKLTHTDGRTMVINVEYNQLDPLLRATGLPDGDVNCGTGYSPFPGNINQLILKLDSYIEELEKTKGAIPEFVNPKYKDASKTSFKSSTRLECMMQDYPKTLPSSARVGFTVMDTWLAYACTS